MKIDKRKIVFGGVIVCVVGFIVLYSLYVFGEEEQEYTIKNPMLPSIEVTEKEYDSKLEAIEDIQPEKERQIPELYEPWAEEELSRVGEEYQEDNLEYWKQDSITEVIQSPSIDSLATLKTGETEKEEEQLEPGWNHTEFFLNSGVEEKQDMMTLKCRVYGDQVLKSGMRVVLELLADTVIENQKIVKNTLVYGQVSMQQNRVMLSVDRIGDIEVSLEAFDLQDKQKGIYIENSFRAEATSELLGDVVDDINISGIPQIRGLKNIFRRSNRNIKVQVLNNYQLLLKSSL